MMSEPKRAVAIRVLRHPSGVVELLLDQADRGNSLDLEAAEQLRAAAESVAGDPGRAVLLRATGRDFCVGGDLRSFAGRGDGTGAYVREVAEAAHVAVERLDALPVPLITAVQGAVAGAGIGLALLGDLVLAARSARFRLAYTAVGLSPDCGASWLLPRLVGPKRAADLLLTNRVLTAPEAEDWGLVSRVLDDAALAGESFALAERIGSGPVAAHAAVKRLIRHSASTSLPEHLTVEAGSIGELADSSTAKAAVTSFLHSRRHSRSHRPPPGVAAQAGEPA